MARKARPPPPGAPRFVAYFRVSTDKQGRSGLGLEAQRGAVERHVSAVGGAILAEFVEVESGKKADRPQVHRALAAARAHRAILIIAKLDRLARNVAFLSNLMEAGVEFVAADMPTANRLTVHILAAVAEEEARMISARTMAALAAAKARGVKLGNPRLRAGTGEQARAAAAERSRLSARHASDVLPMIEAARRAGCLSLGQLAEALTARGVRTASGGQEWDATQVRRVLLRTGRPTRAPAPALPMAAE